jgi:hypothetical protein
MGIYWLFGFLENKKYYLLKSNSPKPISIEVEQQIHISVSEM